MEEIAYETRAAEPRHLLCVGRLDQPHKGLDLLIEVMAKIYRLRGESGTPPLLIVGDGPDRKALERLVEKRGLSHLIEFRGRVEGAEKYRLMAGAHAVLLPSRSETFGMIAVESLAAGVPLVAFDIGPLREVAGGADGARLIRPWDLDAFARETLHFIDDRELRERTRDSGRHWARRYDWDKISLQQEEFYLRTLRETQTFRVPVASSDIASLRGGREPAAGKTRRRYNGGRQ